MYTLTTTSQLECMFLLHTNCDLIGVNKPILINKDN